MMNSNWSLRFPRTQREAGWQPIHDETDDHPTAGFIVLLAIVFMLAAWAGVTLLFM